MAKGGSGVKPPLIGKFTGRVRTPLSIFAAFYALGVLADIVMNGLAVASEWFQTRIHLGFQFWPLIPQQDYTMPDGTVVDIRETIAYDDLILLFMTLAILFVYRIRMKWRLVAAAGFFTGWYTSSMWIGSKLWEQVVTTTEGGGAPNTSGSGGSPSQSPPYVYEG